MRVKDVRTVAEFTVRGRPVEVSRTSWVGTSGLSFDVTDTGSGLLLTPTSLDTQPDEGDVEELVEALVADFRAGSLDPFYAGNERSELAEVLGVWLCEGCGAAFDESDADMIVEHVRDCDRVDGAGHGC